MGIHPPVERIWWKEKVATVELIWIGVAFLWGLVMFFMMIYWHGFGGQNLSNESYRIDPEAFGLRVEKMIDDHTVREDEASGYPVVHPPPGSDVYMLGRLWEWYPILELEKGKSYRLNLSSMDWQHGFSLQPTNINVQVHPGYVLIMTITPTEAGEFSVVCNEFCGIGHHTMIGRILVTE